MKKFLLALGMLSMLAFTACDDSASSSGDNNGSGSKSTSNSKGSFPANGDESFYCEVTSGDGWAQIKVNIPGYKGHVEKRSYDAATETATQYYEEVQYNITEYEKQLMCMEYDRDIKNNAKKNKNLTDYYCDNAVFYMVGTVENASYLKEDFAAAKYEFAEICKDYEKKWEEHGFDEVIERRTSK